ncbi:hypothetical protein ACFL1D_00610 [Candidatus Omnitrophota bacterium]
MFRKGGVVVKGLSFLAIALVFSFSVLLSGCAQEKAASSREAIEAAKAMETMEQKAAYLIQQAKAFYNSQDFKNAVNTAQYILSYVDKDSQAAKDLLEKAKQALASAAKGAMEDVKKVMPGM